MLDGEEAGRHFGALKVSAALHNTEEGMLNPVKFVRGMKQVAESIGVEVYENSRCIHIEQAPIISLYTSLAHLRARDIVLATNAYPDPLGLFRHKIMPFYLYNIVTEPLSQYQLDEFGWQGRIGLFNAENLAWMTHLTADGRLLFINGNALYYHDIDRDYSNHPGEYRSHYKKMIKLFPFLKGIKITHEWGGRLGITFDGLPSIGRRGKHGNIYYSGGYYGHGLAFSQLAGKMLAELMAGEKTELTDHFLINRSLFGVPSASITYLGANSYKWFMKMSDWRLRIGK